MLFKTNVEKSHPLKGMGSSRRSEIMNAQLKNNEMFNNYPDCLNVLQLQQMLLIGRNKAYELLKTGQIKHKRIGKTYIIPKICVLAYLLENL